MKISMILLLMAIILSWVSAQSWHPPSTYQQGFPSVNLHLVDQTVKHQSCSSKAAFQSTQRNEEEAYKARVSRVGSIPPSCKHKCQGCNPCHPIQIPTTSATLPLHYANYEPEGWKCTCGSSFFNP